MWRCMKLNRLLFLVLGLCFSLLVILALFGAGRTLYFSQKLYSSVINGQSGEFDRNYRSWRESSRFWLTLWGRINPSDKYLQFSREAISFLPELLGKTEEKTYFILLQNNMELRATGGFLGSYAKVKFKDGVLSDFIIEDIYVPDGQIIGHVEPPDPIEEAFGQGWWKLRDANWDPDFSKAAKVIDWFFEKGGEEKADGFIGVNLILFREILGITGPVKLINYSQVVREDNFYQTIQAYAEVGFFPGSTQKKNILSDFGLALWEELKKLNRLERLKLLRLVLKNLGEKQILVSIFDENGPDLIGIGWDGALGQASGQDGFLYLVETNLGANKANCCVERRVEHQVKIDPSGGRLENLKIVYKNSSRFESPVPPVFWGGNYINYLRVYLPIISKEIKVKIDGQEIKSAEVDMADRKENKLTEIGFWVRVGAMTEKTVEISFESPGEPAGRYRLTIQKQSGIEVIPYRLELEFGNKVVKISKEIIKDTEIIVPLKYN